MLSVYHCGDISLRGGGKKLVVFVIPIQLPGPAEVEYLTFSVIPARFDDAVADGPLWFHLLSVSPGGDGWEKCIYSLNWGWGGVGYVSA